MPSIDHLKEPSIIMAIFISNTEKGSQVSIYSSIFIISILVNWNFIL